MEEKKRTRNTKERKDEGGDGYECEVIPQSENEDDNEEQDEDEEIHQSPSARLRSTAFTGGRKSVTRKLGDDQNFTHFCRFW